MLRAGLTEAVFRRRTELWLAENKAAKSSNNYVERHGLPLAAFRMF